MRKQRLVERLAEAERRVAELDGRLATATAEATRLRAAIEAALARPIVAGRAARELATHELRMAREEHYLMVERCANGILADATEARKAALLAATHHDWVVASTRYRLTCQARKLAA